MEKPIKVENIEEFKQKNEVYRTLDQYEPMLEELFQIRNPGIKMKPDYPEKLQAFKAEHVQDKQMTAMGNWFYFPWNKTLIHYLADELHQEIRTERNKNLITKEEQEKLYDTTVAVTGLSVGSHAALIIAMSGMAKGIKLADPDEISASNLNRLQYDFTRIGDNKTQAAAESIYQMNPYATIETYPKGVTEENIDEFLSGVDILIEEMDSLPMKVVIRKKAKALGIPVIMATDNGTGVILDVERFDENKNAPLFHGRIELSEEDYSPTARQTNPKLWNKIASEIIGIEFMEENLIDSLGQMGRSISGVPQLGAAASMAGGLVAISAIRIALKKPLPSGKYIFSSELTLDPQYITDEVKKHRDETRNKFREFLNS